MNILYFEGAGMDFYEGTELSDVGNFRIRTSFKNLDGEQYYIELWNGARYNAKKKVISDWALYVDYLYKVTGGKDDYMENSLRIDPGETINLDYTKADITKLINEKLNCNFDTIQVLNEFYGYHVYGNKGKYNLMEDIELNHKRAAARKAVFKKTDMEYRKEFNSKYAVIHMLEMDDEEITIRCYVSDEQIGDKPRVVKVPVAY